MSSPLEDVASPNQLRVVHVLSGRQERKLIDYVEDKFLEITRAFKKRNHPSTTLPTLTSYIDANRPLLAIILQIPPIDPQAALRSALLLRLTGEFLSAVPGYPFDSAALPPLLGWLNELDTGWLTVLQSQVWDPATRAGVDLVVQADGHATSSPVSQTDRTRLRSMLVLGTERMEEWLDGLVVDGAEDLQAALEALGVRQEFEDIFHRTLSEMGDLA